MDYKKNYLIGFLSGICVTLLLFISISSTTPNTGIKPLKNDGTIQFSLSNDDLNLISSMISDNDCDEDRIIKRVLYCLDGSTVGDLSFSTYCNN